MTGVRRAEGIGDVLCPEAIAEEQENLVLPGRQLGEATGGATPAFRSRHGLFGYAKAKTPTMSPAPWIGTELMRASTALAVTGEQREVELRRRSFTDQLAGELPPREMELVGATIHLNFRPRTSPRRLRAPPLSQRRRPSRSMTHAGMGMSASARSRSPSID
jgi:hypothetical protein